MAMAVYSLFQPERWKKLGILAAVSLPALFLFAHNSGRQGAENLVLYGSVWEKIRQVFFPVRVYMSKPLDIFVIAGVVLAIWLLFRAQARIERQQVWLAVGAVLVMVYIAAPTQYGEGGYADVRIIPFLYLLLLAAFRFPRVPRSLIAGFALLVIFRVATVEWMFLAPQRELQQLSLAVDAIPRDAKVFQLGYRNPRGIMGTGDLHFLEYAMIRRGLLVPSLFHLPGVQPIRLVADIYCPNVFCYSWNSDPPDWQKVAHSYDYVWIPKNVTVALPASEMGHVFYFNDSVTVYRMTFSQARYSNLRQSTTTEQSGR
jgi:hypothetical protein